MFIKRICYPINTLGPGNRVGIWFTGCEKNCIGCMSPELKAFENGKDISIREIDSVFKKVGNDVDGVTISGGEPFLQAPELLSLVTYISETITDDIIVFSGYTLNELKSKFKETKLILSKISVLIDGPYIDRLNNGLGMRGSTNQKIHVFKHNDKYSSLPDCERRLQSFRYDNKILLIGIQ